MSAPAWLIRAIESVDADFAGPQHVARAVLDEIPRHVVTEAIMSAAHAVLKQRGISDGGNALSREIANNAAATVLLMLAVDP